MDAEALEPTFDFEDGYGCRECRDSGWRYAEGGVLPCNCDAADRFWQQQSGNAGVPPIWNGLTLDSYQSITPGLELALRAARQFRANLGPAQQLRGIIFTGGTGCGKSMLAAALANSVLRTGRRVIWKNMPKFFFQAASSWKGEEGRGPIPLFDEFDHAHCFVMDDIGGSKCTQSMEDQLYVILEDAAQSRKLVIATSNLPIVDRTGEGKDLRTMLGERNASRLTKMCYALELPGDDLRAAKPAAKAVSA